MCHKIKKNVELLFLFYKSIVNKKMKFVSRKIKVIDTFKLHLFFEIGRFISSSLIIFILHKNIFSYNSNAYVCILFALYFFQNITILFGSVETIKKNFKYHYLQLSSDNYTCKMIINSYFIEIIQILPLVFPFFVGIIMCKNISGFIVAVVIKAFCFCEYTLKCSKRYTKNKFLNLAKAIICRCVPFGIGYLAMSGISKILLLSREGINKYGFSIEYISWIDSKLNNKIYEYFYNLINVFDRLDFNGLSNVNVEMVLTVLVILMLSIGILAARRKPKQREVVFKLPVWYILGIKKKLNKKEICNPYLYKDVCLFFRKGEKLKNSFMDLFAVSEVFISIGSNLVLLPLIKNRYIFMFIFSFEIFGVISGTLRTLSYRFPDIFKFKSDCERWKLLYVTNEINVSHVLASKYYLLKTAAKIPCLIVSILLFISFIPYMKWECMWLGIDVLIILILYNKIVKWVLKSDYDFFCIAVRNKFSVEELSSENYVGYSFIENANKTVNRIFLFCTIFISLIGASFMLIMGVQWMMFFSFYICGFICNLLINASYYSKEMRRMVKEGTVYEESKENNCWTC